MFSMIFNSTNFFILLIVIVICYTFWKPFMISKKAEAMVEGYVHPKGEGDDPTSYAIQFMYRETSGGRKCYCISRRRFDFKQEAKDMYPKGSKVQIRYYERNRGETEAIIVQDNIDLKKSIFYTVAAFAGGSALAVGYQLLVAQLSL